VLQRLIIEIKPLLSKLEFAAEEYKRPIKKTALFFAEKSGGIDLDLIADDLLSKARERCQKLSLIPIILLTNLTSGCLISPTTYVWR
jgi:hypothetical protein